MGLNLPCLCWKTLFLLLSLFANGILYGCQGLALLPPAPSANDVPSLFVSTPSDTDAKGTYKTYYFSSSKSPLEYGVNSWLQNSLQSPSVLKSSSSSSSNNNIIMSPLSLSLPSQILSLSNNNDNDNNNDDTSYANNSNSWTNQILRSKSLQTDKVKRVVDSSTIQLQNSGYVSLQTVRGAGSTYQLPECMTYAPAYKLKQLLPKGTNVKYLELGDTTSTSGANGADGKGGGSGGGGGGGGSTTRRVWIIRSEDDTIINRELVKSGFAFVRKGSNIAAINEEMLEDLNALEQNARRQGLGIFKVCNSNTNSEDGKETNIVGNNSMEVTTNIGNSESFVAEFEPLEYMTVTEWGDDGGKNVLVSKDQFTSSYSSSNPPPNPGDIKGCSDFDTYEDALSWYERYSPYYGDVAKLDRDGDGVPCPGLPHTSVRERYRMKRPVLVDGNQ